MVKIAAATRAPNSATLEEKWTTPAEPSALADGSGELVALCLRDSVVFEGLG